MNRFKKELIKRGISLEHQYPCLPYEVSDNICIDSIIVNAEHCTYTTHYNVLSIYGYFDRSMCFHEIPDDQPVFTAALVDSHPCYSKFSDGTEICHAYDCICINHGKCNSCAKDIAYWEAELDN